MDNWKEKLKKQIDMAADEIKASAYAMLMAAESPIIDAKITIQLDPRKAATIHYDIDRLPIGYTDETCYQKLRR